MLGMVFPWDEIISKQIAPLKLSKFIGNLAHNKNINSCFLLWKEILSPFQQTKKQKKLGNAVSTLFVFITIELAHFDYETKCSCKPFFMYVWKNLIYVHILEWIKIKTWIKTKLTETKYFKPTNGVVSPLSFSIRFNHVGRTIIADWYIEFLHYPKK